jgi:riboflavin kinase/FMN adenylyltransferase
MLVLGGFRNPLFNLSPYSINIMSNKPAKRAAGIEEVLAKVAPKKDMVLTIGVFDGVHLGHKQLISELKKQARQQDLLSGVITFSLHPQEVLSPESRLPNLTDLDQRQALLKEEGVDVVIVLPFGRELSQLSAREFTKLLKKYLRTRGLVIGPDFAMGRNREGDANALRALGKEMGFSVTAVPPVKINDEVVSSTAIRNALAKGDMEKVHRLTGRFFSLHGRVIAGDGRGAKLGFPTANLDIVDPQHAIPADGIYATRAYIDGRTYKSVTNIGTRPTFDGGNRTVEVYIIDFKGNLYGQDLKIDILKRLRKEKRFASVEELKKQMAKDVKHGRVLLDSQEKN